MRRILILNLALIALVSAGFVRLHNDYLAFEATHQPGAIQPQAESLPKVAVPPPAGASPPIDWTEIPTHNLYSFDRTDIAILEAPAPAVPPGAKPILFGTMALGDDRMAMVASGKPGNRNYRPMKVGETIDGWTITQILDLSIVIKANSIEDSVVMNDPSAQVPRDTARTIAPSIAPVISVGQPPPPPASASGPSIFQPPASQPAAGQPPRPRRRITQQTPFGIREIEIEE